MEHPETSPYKVDRSEVVVSRNRYANVQPWDASRIKLRTPISGSDYVNASPIVLKSRSPVSGSSNVDVSVLEVRYIATQGPKQGQISHFWHMVHQELTGDTGVVIMLTQLFEDSKEKCAQYYPIDLEDPTMILQHEEKPRSGSLDGGKDNGEDPFLELHSDSGTDSDQASSASDTNTAEEPEPVTSPPNTLTLLSKELDNSVRCEVRKLQLTINGVSKTIIHYLFGRWPDFGKPDIHDRKALIEMSRRSYKEANGTSRIVHCSAGVGRTGTWIALDFLIREVEEDRLLDSMKPTNTPSKIDEPTRSPTVTETWGKSGPFKVMTPTLEDGFDKDEHDLIFETVNALRDQRMMMVIREVQYSFLYDAVKEAVLEKYKAKPEGATVRDADAEARPRRSKLPRVSDDIAMPDSSSEAETEIMDADGQKEANEDSDDPYSAVSPDFLRRGMSEEF